MSIRNRKFFLLAITIVAIGFAACNKEYDQVFEESADERVGKVMEEYNQVLVSAPSGWMATLTTASDISFNYYFDFNDDGTVTMISDFDATTGGVPQQSDWKLKALQRPTLSFRTYSYIHIPADPDAAISGGEYGEGLRSDFEFAIEKTSDDSVTLKGIQRGSKLTFVKATAQEAQTALSGRYGDLIEALDENPTLYLKLPSGDTIPMAFDTYSRVFGAQYYSAGKSNVFEFLSPFTFTLNGIVLASPLKVGTVTVTGFTWNANQGVYVPTTTASVQPQFITMDTLMIFNPTASRFYNSIGINYAGITVPNGSEMDPLLGQSDDFIKAYKDSDTAIFETGYRLRLRGFDLTFNTADSIMFLDAYVSQTSGTYLARYTFKYSISQTNHMFNFTLTNANGNAALIANEMQPLLGPIKDDHFHAHYVGGEMRLLGMFQSNENPGFYFSGYLAQ